MNATLITLYGPPMALALLGAAGVGTAGVGALALGAGAFIAYKVGDKLSEVILSNFSALVGKGFSKVKNLLVQSKNNKAQNESIIKLKNNLLQQIDEAQLGIIEAKNNKNNKLLHNHLEDLYIYAHVLKELEKSPQGKKQAEQFQKDAFKKLQQHSSSKINARNIFEKTGRVAGKIMSWAIAAGCAAIAALAITTLVASALTTLYGPMIVVGGTAAASILTGVVTHKVSNIVATWSFENIGKVADIAKNAVYEAAAYPIKKTLNAFKDKSHVEQVTKNQAASKVRKDKTNKRFQNIIAKSDSPQRQGRGSSV
ncbi:MAG: hypothetical protein H6909_01495 [Rickettsiaceae bacterium]|nr:hypothetical protein [Rickettsiaceae bacterium]